MKRGTTALLLAAACLAAGTGCSTHPGATGVSLAQAADQPASAAPTPDLSDSIAPAAPPQTAPAAPPQTAAAVCTGSGPALNSSASPAVEDGRLRRTFESSSYAYDPTTLSLSSYRLDPAPGSEKPRLTAAEALADVTRENGSVGEGGQPPIVAFGLVSGSVAIVGPPPNHTLGGNAPVTCRPAWLIIVNGVEVVPDGGAAATGSSPVPIKPVRESEYSVINDADGTPFNGFSIDAATPGFSS